MTSLDIFRPRLGKGGLASDACRRVKKGKSVRSIKVNGDLFRHIHYTEITRLHSRH